MNRGLTRAVVMDYPFSLDAVAVFVENLEAPPNKLAALHKLDILLVLSFKDSLMDQKVRERVREKVHRELDRPLIAPRALLYHREVEPLHELGHLSDTSGVRILLHQADRPLARE